MDCVIVLDASEKATFKALSNVVAVTLNDIAVFASRLLRLLSCSILTNAVYIVQTSIFLFKDLMVNFDSVFTYHEMVAVLQCSGDLEA